MKRILSLSTLAALAAAIAQPALADSGNVRICHNGNYTLSVAQSAVKAHVNHGDSVGSCRSNPTSVLLMRCDLVDGYQTVVAIDSATPGKAPMPLDGIVGQSCAKWMATLVNNKWELKFVSSGSPVAPAEGTSGFVTEYTFFTEHPPVVIIPEPLGSGN